MDIKSYFEIFKQIDLLCIHLTKKLISAYYLQDDVLVQYVDVGGQISFFP